ncbi:type II CRISPR-associated endonuclease Cas1 [Dongia sp.]|uniref:type II CRISPR-associated endonuclease Cas1 n=1 Tax=Dongia sp. TaxID=1977262 RepID=UPI0035B4CE2F
MAWRGLHISREARLRLSDNQLVVTQDDEDVRLALEDIAWIVVDAPAAMLSFALIRACMDKGIVLVFTDERHMPSGMALPFHRHFRQAAVAQLQTSLTAPLAKRLWQAIVMQKIDNQAVALSLCGRPGSKTLLSASRRVRSGDPANVEARAARFYFGRMFRRESSDGSKIGFVRADDGDLRNKMLNYGYAILRSGVARALVAFGLLPGLGLMHASQNNAFNLADDLVEPFRPFADIMAQRLMLGRSDFKADLTLNDRRSLASLLLENCLIGTERTTLLNATERVADTLVRAMDAKTPALLELPRPDPATKPGS